MSHTDELTFTVHVKPEGITAVTEALGRRTELLRRALGALPYDGPGTLAAEIEKELDTEPPTEHLTSAEAPPSLAPHEWSERRGLTVCSRCGMVRNRDRDTLCKGTLPTVQTREAPSPAPPADPFEGADFYTTVEDAEELLCETARDALATWAEDHEHWNAVDQPLSTTVRHALPAGKAVTVYAYKPWKPTEEWIKHRAERVFDDFFERLANEDDPRVMDPGATGRPHNIITREQEADAMARMVTWVRETMAVAKVWHCEQVAKREYTAEQVIEMLGAKG